MAKPNLDSGYLIWVIETNGAEDLYKLSALIPNSAQEVATLPAYVSKIKGAMRGGSCAIVGAVRFGIGAGPQGAPRGDLRA